MKLSGKVALITGGAGGIGLAIAQHLAAEGVRLVLADIDGETLQSAALELQSNGAELMSVRLDVTDRLSWASACAEVRAQFGRADLMFNNAGISFRRAPIGMLAPQDWDRVIAVNLTGVYNGAHYFLSELLPPDEPGHIVNTASICGLVSTPQLGPYTASKFGVVGLSELMRIELAERGVGVSVLCPGLVDTGIAANSEKYSTAKGASEERARMGELLKTSMDPDHIGRLLVEGVKQNKLYIFSHPEYARVHAKRMAAISAAFAAAADHEWHDDITGLGQFWLDQQEAG